MFVRRAIASLISLAILAGALGCSRDPNVRKRKYLESGLRYYDKQQYQEASIEFSNAIQVDPHWSEAHYQLARTFMKMGSWANAFAELSGAIDMDPSNLAARVDLGNLWLTARRIDDAQTQATIILQRDPKLAAGHVLQANIFSAQGKWPDALEELNKATALSPQDSDLYVSLAAVQGASQGAAAAEATLKKAISLNPKFANGYNALGTLYMSQKRWAEAEQQYRHSIELQPTIPGNRIALAKLFLAENRPDAATEVMKQAKRDLKDEGDGYRVYGDFLAGTGQMDKAILEYASLMRDYPKDVGVRKTYISLLKAAGKLDQAAVLTQEILDRHPKDEDAIRLQGEILLAQGKPKEASSRLDIAVKAHPDDPTLQYEAGIADWDIRDVASAEKHWREAVRINPSYTEAWDRLTRISITKNDASEADHDANAIIASSPNQPSGYLLRAAARFALGLDGSARTDIEKAISLSPRSAIGYSKMGQFLLVQNRPVEAEKVFHQALEIDPSAIEPVSGLVNVYFMIGQPAKAVAEVSGFIKRKPNDAIAYMMLGTALSQTRDLEGSERALQKARDLAPKNAEAYRLLAELYTMEDNQSAAANMYVEWLKVMPTDVRALIGYGSLEEKRGNDDHAELLYRKALQASPDNPAASNNLAYLMLLRGGNIDVALSLAQTAVRYMPDSPRANDTLAWAYVQKGSYDMAVDVMERVVKSSPPSAVYEYHLGIAYKGMGNKAKAREHLSRSLALDSTSVEAQEIRKLLASMS